MGKTGQKLDVMKTKIRGERRPFKCPYQGCPRTYAVEYNLQRHIRTNHKYGRTD